MKSFLTETFYRYPLYCLAGRYASTPSRRSSAKDATPNRLGVQGDKRDDTARALMRRYKNNPQGSPAPIPLENCPWCGTRFTPNSFTLLPNTDQPTDMRIVCSDFTCDFAGNRALPIIAVDETIYRRLPAFLIATVDKFAALPWEGSSGALLGGADRHDASGFYAAAEPQRGRRHPTRSFRTSYTSSPAPLAPW